MNGCSQRFGKGAEEVGHQLRGQAPNALAVELRNELGVRATAQIDGNLCARFVHRQQKTIAPDTDLRAQGAAQRLAQCQGAIFHGVMLINLEIALASELEREAAMLGELLEH